MKKRLDVQKDEYEETIKRHLSFIDQVQFYTLDVNKCCGFLALTGKSPLKMVHIRAELSCSSLFTQLIDDKKTLSEKCEHLVKELKTVDRKYSDRIKTLQEK